MGESATEEGLYYSTHTWGGGGQTEGTSSWHPAAGARRPTAGDDGSPAPPGLAASFHRRRRGSSTGSSPAHHSCLSRRRPRRARGKRGEHAAAPPTLGRGERWPPACTRPSPPLSPLSPRTLLRPAPNRHPNLRRRPPPQARPRPTPAAGRAEPCNRGGRSPTATAVRPPAGKLQVVPHRLCSHVSAAAARCGRLGRNRAQALKGDKAAIATIASSAAILSERGWGRPASCRLPSSPTPIGSLPPPAIFQLDGCNRPCC